MGAALLAIQDSYGRHGEAQHHPDNGQSHAFTGNFHQAADRLQSALADAKSKFAL